MKDYVNPNSQHYTDGQIVGDFSEIWSKRDNRDITDFKSAIKQYSVKLAKPSDDPFNSFLRPKICFVGTIDCDCDYHPGGCSISKKAPKNTACQCSYTGGWSCSGSVRKCSNDDSSYCKNPDYSRNSCIQGRGDCDGYKCDCDYYPGGCSISKKAPKNTACQCSYTGGWSCSGSVRQCTNPNSQYCKNPDKTINSCRQGRGDCDGYSSIIPYGLMLLFIISIGCIVYVYYKYYFMPNKSKKK
eukprot:518708_1